MELDKKKYSRTEVENLISNVQADYEEKLASHKLRINELIDELRKANVELDTYRQNDEKIASAIKDAEEFSVELKNKATKKYNAEIESLKSFAVRWRTFFNALKEKYPLYGNVNKANEAYEIIAKISLEYTSDDAIIKVADVMDNVAPDMPFNPQDKINDYISATSDNGFNLNDVLNPGELELEELCKELGLIDEN